MILLTEARMYKQTIRILPALIGLTLLVGCASGPGVTGVFALVLLLSFFTACSSSLYDEDRVGEALLRSLFRKSASSSASAASCTDTRDYTRNFDLSAADPATAGFGFTITGENSGDDFGNSVAGAGDFNGDGIDDIVVNAPFYNSNDGRVYLVFGRSGARGDIDTATMTTSDGIRIIGQAGEYLGYTQVAAAGDVNGDGFDDLLMSNVYAGTDYGGAYLIFGKANPTDIAIATLTATDGVTLQGGGNYYYAGTAVAGLGDVNGDGLDDFAILQKNGSTYGSGDYGEASVIFGKTSGWTGLLLNPATITGATGFTVRGEGIGANWGSVSGVGDLNGDGVNDFLIGSQSENGGNGAVYVIYGINGTRTDIDLFSGPLSASDGYEIYDSGPGRWGYSVGGGDFNGDGQPDITVGARAYNGGEGQVAVLKGDVGATDLGALAAGQGSILSGVTSSPYNVGNAVSMKGDVDGDGFDDLLVGARSAGFSASSSGSAFLVFGQSDLPTSGASVSGYTGGTTGIRIDGALASARLGESVDLADVNGDGCADMILGAPATGTGRAYVIFGGEAQ